MCFVDAALGRLICFCFASCGHHVGCDCGFCVSGASLGGGSPSVNASVSRSDGAKSEIWICGGGLGHCVGCCRVAEIASAICSAL